LTDLARLLELSESAELKLIFWEETAEGSLRQILGDKGSCHHVCIFVGSEGGFSAKEVEQAVAAGFCKVSLGRRILRAETAAITVVGLLQYELGDLGLSS
jgi:16S rRNA (uracil1498-N3)-methyltransferase